jgi:hypothetical protein
MQCQMQHAAAAPRQLIVWNVESLHPSASGCAWQHVQAMPMLPGTVIDARCTA